MKINNIAVIGAGTMGHGIAQVFALAGYQVTLIDNNPEILGKAIARIQSNLEICMNCSAIHKDDAAVVPERISLASDMGEGLSQAEFIVEAVIENIEIKRSVLGELEELCSKDTIITSTTSSYCVRDLVAEMRHPERFLVTHYWNPPYVIPIVEVMPGEHTNAEVVSITISHLKAVGKYPALVKKDIPGFVGNRLQHALRREAIAIVDQGIASPEDVDLIAKLSFGLRLPVIGPLETVDLGGLDLTQAIQTYLLPELDRSTEPKQIIQDKVERGELGAKTGKGFFDWTPDRVAMITKKRDETLLEMIEWLRERGFMQRSID
jgi:3-hydroxybutyryl-CoA dehydrogenase